MNNIDKLINWNEISRLLAGHRSSITKDRVPKKHEEKINNLRNKLSEWLSSVSSNGA